MKERRKILERRGKGKNLKFKREGKLKLRKMMKGIVLEKGKRSTFQKIFRLKKRYQRSMKK